MKIRLTPLALTLALLLACAMLAGCGGKAPEAPAESATTEAARAPKEPDSIKVTVTNGSDYQFIELYVSPSAANEWGDDHLGSTSLLKRNGSFDITLDKYEFNTYDIRVVDEDDDVYLFGRVPLNNGSEVVIGFGENGLVAEVTHADGTTEAVAGELQGADGGGGGGGAPAAEAPAPTVTGTGNDTNGLMEFTVYNESDYEIYAIYVGVSNAAAEDDLDILPATIPPHESADASVVASQGDWLNTEWTMYVTDVDGDTSASFETFNPWLLSYVDISWDSNAGGYVCNFVYD